MHGRFETGATSAAPARCARAAGRLRDRRAGARWMLVCPLRFTVSSPSRGEALDLSGMAVLPNDTRAASRGHLGGHAARLVLPGKLNDRGAFAGYGVLPDLAHLYRCAVRRTVRLRVPHASNSRTRLSNSKVKALPLVRQSFCQPPFYVGSNPQSTRAGGTEGVKNRRRMTVSA